MNFIDSTKHGLTNYANFKTRSSRSQFWWFYLFTFIASLIAGIMDVILFGTGLTDPTPITWAIQFGFLLPSIAVGIRRLHDLGKSGWFCLIPIYNIVLFATEGEPVPNMYGPVPNNIREGNSGTPHVMVQQPMQQQYQQPMQQQYQQPPPGY